MEFEQIVERLKPIFAKHVADQKQGSFLEYFSPEELKRMLDLDAAGKSGDWDALFSWVEKYLSYSVKTNHPGFVNRMWAGANLPSVVGEVVTAISNTSACTYESAPVSTLMEKYMISRMLEVVGFENGEGQMTTGSSNANMIAMMAARNTAFREIKQRGLFGQKALYAFVNADAHYSMDKAANILGIGTEHLIKVAVNENGAMDLGDLKRQMASVAASEGHSFFVGATAGTTVRGAYDDLSGLLDLRDQYGFWLHVDGAWGGAVVLSERLREQYLKGVEKADSFTTDFHKMMGTALMCNVLLINGKQGIFSSVCGAGDTSYLFQQVEDKDEYNLGAHSLQCGRRVDSLKWFLDWKFYGIEGFARRIETYEALCRYAEDVVLETPELEMVVPRESFNICFRYAVPEDMANAFNMVLRTKLYESGVSLVGTGTIGKKLSLRLLIANSSFGKTEVSDWFKGVVVAGKKLMEVWE